MEMTIKKELTPEDRTGVALKAQEGGKIIANEAGMVTVRTENLETTDVGEVEITIKVSFKWILEFGRQNVRIAHVGDDGEVELLSTVCDGPDDNNEFICVGTTKRGFSEFSLVDRPPDFSAKNLVVTPEAMEPGETVKVSVDIVNDGIRAGSFSAILKLKRPGSTEFEAVNVEEITLAGGERGTVTFFVLSEVDDDGQFDVEIEGRKGEFLTGTYGVFKALAPANLSYSDLKIEPEEVRPGEPVEITMFITNADGEGGRTVIELRINEVLTEIWSLSIPGEQTVPVSFEFIPPVEGTFTVTIIDPEELIEPQRGEVTATIPLEPASFFLSNLDITPVEVFAGDEMTISFELVNLGELLGELTVRILINGLDVASQDVSREALFGAAETFTITAPTEPGDYTLNIEGVVLVGDPDLLPLRGTFKVLTPPVRPVVKIVKRRGNSGTGRCRGTRHGYRAVR